MAKSNYADAPAETGGLPEHRLRFGDEYRAYTPTSGETDTPGHFGGLGAGAHGDSSGLGWAWKPERDKGLTHIGRRFPFTTYSPGPHLRYCWLCDSVYCACPA